ncbi:MAG: hypothetical protein BA869_10765 [Desulfuromonadales bacterium C00003107]|jgi:outer membrane scaffolding protein for murein synthesis (MipA/OmpV family)|nr:MAG: hypothetical protein BA869_10765 [Desulfuromonadales bacterium C00003107]
MKTTSKTRKWLVEVLFVGMAIFCLPLLSIAADTDISLGLGVAAVPDYEGSDDYEAVPIPYVSVTWESGRFIRLSGNRLGANILAGGTWQFGPVLQFRSKRDDDVDNSAVSKLRKVDNAVEAGAFVGFKASNWDISAQVVNDVSDEHEGMLATAKAGYTMESGNFSTRVGLSSTYADDDYMDTYFSIDADNAARSGLSTYSADSGIKDVGIDLNMRLRMSDSWEVMGLLGYTKLLNDAKDSPIVDQEGDDNQFMAGLTVIYNF